MKKCSLIILFFISLTVFKSYTQSVSFPQDTVPVSVSTPDTNNVILQGTTLPPIQKISGMNILKSVGITQLYNLTMSSILLAMPAEISNWDTDTKFQWTRIESQYINSFTRPPVIDKDMFFINYIGHPYQGAFYYNSLRSKGATIAQSALFNFSQILLWEYVWEGGMEQPSIQDLITTPILGSVLGELAHRATIGMKKKGFLWYEKVLVTVINPSYVINNGYK